MLKMSVKTSVSSTAQSLSTHPGMLSGPEALHALILLRDLLTLSRDSIITWSPGGGGVFCAVVLFCAPLQASKEGIQLIQQGDGAVTGLWWGLIDRDGLYSLPQAPSVSAVRSWGR